MKSWRLFYLGMAGPQRLAGEAVHGRRGEHGGNDRSREEVHARTGLGVGERPELHEHDENGDGKHIKHRPLAKDPQPMEQ